MPAETAPACLRASPALTLCPGRSCSPPEVSRIHWTPDIYNPPRLISGTHPFQLLPAPPAGALTAYGAGPEHPPLGTGSRGRARADGERLALPLRPARNSVRPGRRRPRAAANGPEVRDLIKCHLVKVTANASGYVKIMGTQPARGFRISAPTAPPLNRPTSCELCAPWGRRQLAGEMQSAF